MAARSPADPDDPFCHCGVLRKATRRVSQLYDAALAPSGLKFSQYQLLSHIARAGGSPTMGELAKSMVLDRSALAHNLKPLERDGLLEQRPDPDDGRSRRVALTAAGRGRLLKARRLWAAAQVRFRRAYGPERAHRLAAALDEILSDRFAAAFEDAA